MNDLEGVLGLHNSKFCTGMQGLKNSTNKFSNITPEVLHGPAKIPAAKTIKFIFVYFFCYRNIFDLVILKIEG